MKKIMFNDRYGLTQAVLGGHKTMTRRIVPERYLSKVEDYQQEYFNGALEPISHRDALLNMATGERMFKDVFQIGEVVAVAQSYENVHDYYFYNKDDYHLAKILDYYLTPGWSNKMFVRADLMPHQIQITDINVERLQDITYKDCVEAGIYYDADVDGYKVANLSLPNKGFRGDLLRQKYFFTPREDFAAFIDKVSGNGTWERNPWVFVYEFKLVK